MRTTSFFSVLLLSLLLFSLTAASSSATADPLVDAEPLDVTDKMMEEEEEMPELDRQDGRATTLRGVMRQVRVFDRLVGRAARADPETGEIVCETLRSTMGTLRRIIEVRQCPPIMQRAIRIIIIILRWLDDRIFILIA